MEVHGSSCPSLSICQCPWDAFECDQGDSAQMVSQPKALSVLAVHHPKSIRSCCASWSQLKKRTSCHHVLWCSMKWWCPAAFELLQPQVLILSASTFWVSEWIWTGRYLQPGVLEGSSKLSIFGDGVGRPWAMHMQNSNTAKPWPWKPFESSHSSAWLLSIHLEKCLSPRWISCSLAGNWGDPSVHPGGFTQRQGPVQCISYGSDSSYYVYYTYITYSY